MLRGYAIYLTHIHKHTLHGCVLYYKGSIRCLLVVQCVRRSFMCVLVCMCMCRVSQCRSRTHGIKCARHAGSYKVRHYGTLPCSSSMPSCQRTATTGSNNTERGKQSAKRWALMPACTDVTAAAATAAVVWMRNRSRRR